MTHAPFLNAGPGKQIPFSNVPAYYEAVWQRLSDFDPANNTADEVRNALQQIALELADPESRFP